MKVLVVIARGLQANSLSCYGNSWIESPNLDFLASEGIAFDWHFADAVDPDSVRRVRRSGRYHFPSLDPTSPAPPATADLIAALRQHDIYTSLVRDDSHAAPHFFESHWDAVVRVAPPPADSEDTPLLRTLDAARTAFKDLAGRESWLLWIELATPLPPWDVPEDFREPYFSRAVEKGQAEEDQDEQIEFEDVEADEEIVVVEDDQQEELEVPAEEELSEEPQALAELDTVAVHEEVAGETDEEAVEIFEPIEGVYSGPIDPVDDTLFLRFHSSYAAAVSYLDAGIGQLLENLGDAADDVMLVITTDAGESLGEHGIVGPGQPPLHEEVAHLPLIVRLPGGAEAGRRVAALTQPVDLAPTLADVFAVPFPDAHGQSLVQLMQGDVEAVRPYACGGQCVGEVGQWSLRTPDWAFLLSTSQEDSESACGPELYVKPDDRWEVNNLAQREPGLAEQMERTLRSFLQAVAQAGPLLIPALSETADQALVAPESPAEGSA